MSSQRSCRMKCGLEARDLDDADAGEQHDERKEARIHVSPHEHALHDDGRDDDGR